MCKGKDISVESEIAALQLKAAIVKNIVDQMVKQNVDLRQLAKRANTSMCTLAHVFNVCNIETDIKILTKLALALNCDLNILLGQQRGGLLMS